MNYCVYFHINESTHKVFYVGIGNKKRPSSKRSRSDFWKNIVEKYGYYIEIVHTNLTFDEACCLEIKYIKEYGRLDIGTGILVNLTNGGEGSDGYKHTDDTKIKIKNHWVNYRGFELPEDIEEYNREYNRNYIRKYRESEEVKLKYQKYSRDKYHNMTDSEKEEHRAKKKAYRDNRSDEQKEKDRINKKKFTENMSDEKREEYRKRNREKMRLKRLEKKELYDREEEKTNL